MFYILHYIFLEQKHAVLKSAVSVYSGVGLKTPWSLVTDENIRNFSHTIKCSFNSN